MHEASRVLFATAELLVSYTYAFDAPNRKVPVGVTIWYKKN